MWPQRVWLQRLLCSYCQVEGLLGGVPVDPGCLWLRLLLDINSSEHILQKQKFLSEVPDRELGHPTLFSQAGESERRSGISRGRLRSRMEHIVLEMLK